MRIIRLLLLTFLILAIPATSFAQFAVSISIAPPALPVYAQPVAPADGYLWTPGYWAYGDEGYFWVPGTWVMAPEVGLLWTPGYWGWGGNSYAWNEGYWGTQVGFYGGVDYGFGYGGVGYEGGYWNHGSFYYNRSVNNVSGGNFHNVYTRTVHNTAFNHVSYNGGSGGISARPTHAEEAASHEQHRQPTAMQTQHVQAARSDHALLASVNQGRPAIAATAKPGELSGGGVVAARQAGALYKAAENRAAAPSATNSTPRSGNSAVRSQPAPRPQTTQRPESHAQSMNRPAPAVREQPQARQQSAPRPQAQQSMSRPGPAVREQPQARQQSAPRPQAQQSMSRPAPAARPQPAARQESAPRQQTQARAQSAPRSEGKDTHSR
jgi:YXWGXW repeat-containing protein